MPFAPPPLPLEDWIPPGKVDTQKRVISPYRLLKDIMVAWPWPYTADQIKQIGEMVPAERRSKRERGVVIIARLSICGRDAQDRVPGSPKINVRAEIERAATARSDFLTALKNLSPESHEFLHERDDRWNKQFSDALESMLLFEYANLSSTHAPGAARGPPEENGLAWAAHQLDLLWIGAHRGDRPKNGFPAFREAALQPLFGEYESKTLESRLPKWRAAHAKPPLFPEKGPK
jgi:hypothetical protein